MAFWIHAENVVGTFVEQDTNNVFEFSLNQGPVFSDFPHRVWVGGLVNDQSYRYARVLKTVAYIVVDETADGEPVVEKWYIKRRHDYA